MAGLWLSIYWEFHHPNWLSLTHIFQRAGEKPPTRVVFILWGLISAPDGLLTYSSRLLCCAVPCFALLCLLGCLPACRFSPILAAGCMPRSRPLFHNPYHGDIPQVRPAYALTTSYYVLKPPCGFIPSHHGTMVSFGASLTINGGRDMSDMCCAQGYPGCWVSGLISLKHLAFCFKILIPPGRMEHHVTTHPAWILWKRLAKTDMHFRWFYFSRFTYNDALFQYFYTHRHRNNLTVRYSTLHTLHTVYIIIPINYSYIYHKPLLNHL